MKFFITASITDEGLDILEKFGEVDYQPMVLTNKMIGGTMLVKKLNGVDIFITEADYLKQRDISRLETLQVICSCRGNPVNIDVDAATEKDIPVLRVPSRNAQGVSELTVALMLMLLRNIEKASAILRREDSSEDMGLMKKIFFDLKGRELWKKTIGIIGFGGIGRKVASLLKPFEVNLLAFDPYVDGEVMEALGVEKTNFEDLLKRSDIVTLHVMPAESNKGLINREALSLMKSSAYFVNTGRSWCTDEEALFEVLRDKKIAGAAFDVFDKEPLPYDHPFFSLDNVILLPHIGGNTYEVKEHQSEILIPDLEKLLKGERPENLMNPSIWDSFELKKR